MTVDGRWQGRRFRTLGKKNESLCHTTRYISRVRLLRNKQDGDH
ncbi:hypothetical protein HMPREF1615_00212 [Escherichia coli 908632]|nr:hypothetical protein HMPREF1615_00212 [Escherichia coli 908632]